MRLVLDHGFEFNGDCVKSLFGVTHNNDDTEKKIPIIDAKFGGDVKLFIEYLTQLNLSTVKIII